MMGVWYSPSIFLVHCIFIKRHNSCKTFNLRDIFPKWALDMGSIRSFHTIFKLNERFQYSVANTIGYQSSLIQLILKNLSEKINKTELYIIVLQIDKKSALSQ